jgi:hypothetical protein
MDRPTTTCRANLGPARRPFPSMGNCQIKCSVSVGLITRTEDDVSPVGAGDPSARLSLGGLYSVGGTLAGAPTWPLWPGAVRHVQSESLKAHRTVSSAVYQLPAWRSVTACGL